MRERRETPCKSHVSDLECGVPPLEGGARSCVSAGGLLKPLEIDESRRIPSWLLDDGDRSWGHTAAVSSHAPTLVQLTGRARNIGGEGLSAACAPDGLVHTVKLKPVGEHNHLLFRFALAPRLACSAVRRLEGHVDATAAGPAI